jgi:uncharacterized repeat protein (TIGR01451 family)
MPRSKIQFYTFGAVSAAMLSLTLATPSFAAGTQAGTIITNTATATYDEGAGAINVSSNANELLVDEVIDVTIRWSDPADVSAAPASTGKILKFEVTNTGNGQEAFTFTPNASGTIGNDTFDPTVTQIYIDTDKSGDFSASDTLYAPGTAGPLLAPDEKINVFIISTMPGGLADNSRGGVTLTAASTTASGSPGTVAAGKGDAAPNGTHGDAVVGNTGGSASTDGFYKIAAATLALRKEATQITHALVNDQVIPGAEITYTITATATGSGVLPNLVIRDTIPAGTTYVPGSITLDAATQTDAQDSDGATFTANAIAVALGNVQGGTAHVVAFKVKVN